MSHRVKPTLVSRTARSIFLWRLACVQTNTWMQMSVTSEAIRKNSRLIGGVKGLAKTSVGESSRDQVGPKGGDRS
jgi:hypothetical protein